MNVGWKAVARLHGRAPRPRAAARLPHRVPRTGPNRFRRRAGHVAASRGSPKPAASSWNTYTVSHTEGADDVPALTAALSSGNITANTTILFKKGTTYNIWSAIQFPTLNNVEVAIEGNLTYPESITDVQSACSIMTNVSHTDRTSRCRSQLGKLI